MDVAAITVRAVRGVPLGPVQDAAVLPVRAAQVRQKEVSHIPIRHVAYLERVAGAAIAPSAVARLRPVNAVTQAAAVRQHARMAAKTPHEVSQAVAVRVAFQAVRQALAAVVPAALVGEVVPSVAVAAVVDGQRGNA